jgi:hypothetical protein
MVNPLAVMFFARERTGRPSNSRYAEAWDLAPLSQENRFGRRLELRTDCRRFFSSILDVVNSSVVRPATRRKQTAS